MRVSWTSEAADDLERIAEVIARDRPDAALRTARTIYEGIASLESHPNRGRLGWVQGTREMVFAPLPYLAVYRVNTQGVEILHIYHGSQNWRK